MENKGYVQNILVPVLLIVILVMYWDPFMVLMPEGLLMTSLLLLVLLYVVFAIYVWQEASRDERELYHKLYASRVAYLAGSAMLVVSVLYQVFFVHHVDPWILLTLSVMVIAKAAGTLHSALSR